VGWEPRFRINEGFGPKKVNDNGDKVLADPARGRFKGFGLNNRMYFQKDTFARLWTDEVDEAAASDFYAELNPNIQLVGADGNAVNLKGKPAAVAAALKEYQKATVKWDVTGGLGYKEGLWEFKGGAHGVHPLSDLGESYIHYSVRLEFRPRTMHTLYSFTDDAGKPVKETSAWSGLMAYAEYTYGEKEPNFVKEDMFTVGVGIRF
jgi:hypothetical protein